jgi:hypothetical protein
MEIRQKETTTAKILLLVYHNLRGATIGYTAVDSNGIDCSSDRKIHHARKGPGGFIVTILIGIARGFVGTFAKVLYN